MMLLGLDEALLTSELLRTTKSSNSPMIEKTATNMGSWNSTFTMWIPQSKTSIDWTLSNPIRNQHAADMGIDWFVCLSKPGRN
jgi:hypothetical protein